MRSIWNTRAAKARRLGWLSLVAVLGLAVLSMAAQAKRVALLVGVGQYPGLPPRAQLAGPEHDAQALREVLIQKWDFRPDDIHTLLDKQATKPAVMAALRALQSRSAAGDEVVVYLSGHCTSALNSAFAQLPVPHGREGE